ncbi:MAG: hypothetical protein PHU23_12410 [Dehalococcoidales bacterium]|nr:hypothetical protein [Dehalococcoidales bacterium]
MKKKKILVFLSILLILTLILSTGCNTNAPATETSTTAAQTTGTTDIESNRWLDLLNVLPANETTYNAAFLRDDAYWAQMTTQYPQAVSPLYPDDSACLIPLFGESRDSYSDEAWLAELGFTKADANKSIYAGLAPLPLRYQAVYGQFDKSKIENAVKNGPYKILPETVAYQGYDFYSWGDDNQISLNNKTPVRPMGIGNRMALINNFIFWVQSTSKMQDMIDCYSDKIDSLADSKSFQELAEVLAEANTFRAFFSSVSYSLDNIKEQYRSAFEQSENMSDPVKRLIAEYQNSEVPLLKPFDALATGVGVDEKGYYLIIALFNSNSSVAKENAAIFEQRIKQMTEPFSGKTWQDLTTETEVYYEGQVTTAKLYGEAGKYWNEFAIIGSGMVQPLVIHE